MSDLSVLQVTSNVLKSDLEHNMRWPVECAFIVQSVCLIDSALSLIGLSVGIEVVGR